MREGPVIYRHDIGPIEALGMAGAQAYGKLDSRLINHIEDNIRHITDEERTKWNNKVNKAEYDSVISTINREITNIKGTIQDYTGSGDAQSSFVTSAELATVLQNYVPASIFNSADTVPSSISGYIGNRAQSAVNDALSGLFVYDSESEELVIPS